MRIRRFVAVGLVFGLLGGLAACGSDADVADLERRLAEVEAERDALEEQTFGDLERYRKTEAVKIAIREILDDPEAFGTQEEVAELLATYSTPGALMEDDAFGAVPMMEAWFNTLYLGAMDAEIEVWHQWIADDGSQSGALWIWHGSNAVGNPFEVVGVSIDTHDAEGRVAHELVIYPYSDTYMNKAVFGAGTTTH